MTFFGKCVQIVDFEAALCFENEHFFVCGKYVKKKLDLRQAWLL